MMTTIDPILLSGAGIVVNGQYIALGRELPGATQRVQVFTAVENNHADSALSLSVTGNHQ